MKPLRTIELEKTPENNLTLKRAFKNFSRPQKIAILFCTAIIPPFCFILAMVGITKGDLSDPDVLEATLMGFIIGAVFLGVFYGHFLRHELIQLNEREILFEKGRKKTRISLENIIQVVTSYEKKSVIIAIIGRKETGKDLELIGCSMGFTEDEKLHLLNNLKELAIKYKFPVKENLTKEELFTEVRMLYEAANNTR